MGLLCAHHFLEGTFKKGQREDAPTPPYTLFRAYTGREALEVALVPCEVETFLTQTAGEYEQKVQQAVKAGIFSVPLPL